MTQQRFFELVYAWKDGHITGDELYHRLHISPAIKRSEQLIDQIEKERQYCIEIAERNDQPNFRRRYFQGHERAYRYAIKIIQAGCEV